MAGAHLQDPAGSRSCPFVVNCAHWARKPRRGLPGDVIPGNGGGMERQTDRVEGERK